MSIGGYIRRTYYWANDYLHKKPVGKHYNEIKTILENRKNMGNEIRKELLYNILNHAKINSKFYTDFDSNSIDSFPIINKTIIQENYDDFLVNPSKIPEFSGKMYIQRTSGSTGIPFAVPQDTRKRNRRIAELKYFGKIVGFNSHEKLVQLRAWNNWQNKTKSQSFKENIVAFNISNLNDNKFADLYRILNKNHAIALRGYASSIDLFIRYIENNNLKLPKLKIIIAGSETLIDSTRELVKQHIGCNIISQYANEENGILAQEALHSSTLVKHFYLNHASYYFEIMKLEKDEPAEYGELGRIVVTDFFNFAMPLIRYDTGDTGIMLKNDNISNGFPVLSNLYGRRLDLIYDINNNPVHPMAIGRILKNYPDIIQWQFVQKNQSKYLLKLKIKNSNFISECVRQLSVTLGCNVVHIEVEFVNEITILSSGKRKPVVNEWKK